MSERRLNPPLVNRLRQREAPLERPSRVFVGNGDLIRSVLRLSVTGDCQHTFVQVDRQMARLDARHVGEHRDGINVLEDVYRRCE